MLDQHDIKYSANLGKNNLLYKKKKVKLEGKKIVSSEESQLLASYRNS